LHIIVNHFGNPQINCHMQTSKNIQISDILDEIARGSSLDQSLNLIAQKATLDLNAETCKIWVVKHGDICEQCPLASICSNRQMCLHLASINGSSLEKEFPRIPISVLNTSAIVRGGIADSKDNNLASEKLFGTQQTEHPDTPNSYALYPLRGISGTVGLIGVFNTRQIDKSELQSLAQLSPAAVAAIRVAELQARCDSLRYQIEKSANNSTQTSDKELESANAELKNQIEQLQNECDSLLTNKQENQNRILALEEDNLRLQEQIASLSNQLQEKSRNAAEMDSQFKQQSNNLQEEYTRVESIMTVYEQNIATLKSEQASIKHELSECYHEMASLKKELVASQSELVRIQDNVTHLEAQISVLEETNAELRDYNTALVEKVETLESSLQMAEGLCTSIEQKRATLEAKLNDITDEAEQLRLAYTHLEDQKRELSEETQSLEGEVRRLTESNNKLGEEHFQLAEVNERLSEKQQVAEARFAEFEHENTELKDANAQLEAAVKQLESLIPKLEESVDNLSSRTELSERLYTEIEQSNQALAQENRQLASKAQVSTKLIANVSHELRSPINSIVGFSSLILDDTSLNLPEKHRHNLERISDNSRNLSEFINKILDFSKIEAGHMDVYSEPVELKDVLSRAIAVAEGLRGNRQINIQAELQKDLPTLRTDKTKLQQILLNLLSNAVNFTNAGKIKITATSAEDNHIRIAIQDTGIGIAESDKAKIFEEFHQVNNPNRQTKSGTGLGLAITRRLVTLLGGEIEVESQIDEGATFIVTLPTEIESSQSPASEIAPQELDQERTALIVSRDVATIYLIRKYLTEAGYSVATTADAEHGLEIIIMAKPALIAFDFDSPETSANTLRQIADSKKNGKLIALSSNVNGERQAINNGADAFLTKPVEKAELLAVLTGEKEPTPEFVLVVDDDADALEIVTSMLEDNGYAVKTATDGRAAMELISHSKPAAIVLDLMLPEMDGFEVAHRLQLSPRWREIPVVLLTARDLSNEERTVLNFHSARILQKGNFNREDLLAEIHAAVGDRQKS
jgi:signal transduction histidine kinase/DNA-binding response OmpR family regulator